MDAAFGDELVFQFVAERGVGSRAIRYLGTGPYSHVDCQLEDGTLLGSRLDRVRVPGVSQPIPAGVQIRPANYSSFIHATLYRLPCTLDEKQRCHAFLYSQIGKPYDWRAIVGFVPFLSGIVARNWRENDSWFCSELAGAALEFSNRCGSLSVLSARLEPVTLATVLSALGAHWAPSPPPILSSA